MASNTQICLQKSWKIGAELTQSSPVGPEEATRARVRNRQNALRTQLDCCPHELESLSARYHRGQSRQIAQRSGSAIASEGREIASDAAPVPLRMTWANRLPQFRLELD